MIQQHRRGSAGAVISLDGRRYVRRLLDALPIAAYRAARGYRGSRTINTNTLKSMLGTLNPSPLFEAVATFAEELAIKDSGLSETLHGKSSWRRTQFFTTGSARHCHRNPTPESR